MADFSGLLSFGARLFADLPEFLLIVQILLYWGFLLFFGWIVMIGYRTYSSPLMKFLIRLCFGFISLISGISISGLINFGELGPFQLLYTFAQLDVFIGGLISSLILLVSVYLVSRNVFNIDGLKKAIENMQKRLKDAEKAKRIRGKERFRNPSLVIGLLIFVCFLIFALLNFHGYPLLSERFFSALGISQEDLSFLIESAGKTQNITGKEEECANVIDVVQANYAEMLNKKLPVYKNPDTKRMLESETNSEVLLMYTAKYEGKDYILSVTDKDEICSATEKALCSCFDYGNMMD